MDADAALFLVMKLWLQSLLGAAELHMLSTITFFGSNWLPIPLNPLTWALGYLQNPRSNVH